MSFYRLNATVYDVEAIEWIIVKSNRLIQKTRSTEKE